MPKYKDEFEFHEKSYIASGAEVHGCVKLGEFSSIWHNASMRGDMSAISIGRYSNVQDNAVIHVSDDYPATIGDYVSIGHGAIVHGATIEDEVLVGMGSIILNGAKIGKGSIIGAGALILENTVIPPNSLAVGSPAKIIRTDENQAEHNRIVALRYKMMWTEDYGYLPNSGGEVYEGDVRV